MAMTDKLDYGIWVGHQAVDTSGKRVGKVSEVYMDDSTSEPAWVCVSIKAGLFANLTAFVPVRGVRPEGGRLRLPYDKEMVKGAPQVDQDGDGHLSGGEERQLYRYYTKRWAHQVAGSDGPST